MKRPFRKDIKDIISFKRNGYQYSRVKDYGNNFYLYEMTNPEITDNSIKRYELVRGIKVKQPDGSTVYTYPSDESFGSYGWYITGSEDYCNRKINEYLLKYAD